MIRRLFQFTRRSARDIRADVDEELRFHIEARTDALVSAGVDVQVAREQALREFGDVDDARQYIRRIDQTTEAARRRSDCVGELRQDIVYALRRNRSSPTWVATSIRMTEGAESISRAPANRNDSARSFTRRDFLALWE